MHETKKKRLQAAGWTFGSAEEFLGLSALEVAYLELRQQLADGLRQRRQQQGLTQVALAERLGSSQSRVAKMEAGDPTVSVDLLLRALLSLGASRAELAQLIAGPSSKKKKRSPASRRAAG